MFSLKIPRSLKLWWGGEVHRLGQSPENSYFWKASQIWKRSNLKWWIWISGSDGIASPSGLCPITNCESFWRFPYGSILLVKKCFWIMPGYSDRKSSGVSLIWKSSGFICCQITSRNSGMLCPLPNMNSVELCMRKL